MSSTARSMFVQDLEKFSLPASGWISSQITEIRSRVLAPTLAGAAYTDLAIGGTAFNLQGKRR